MVSPPEVEDRSVLGRVVKVLMDKLGDDKLRAMRIEKITAETTIGKNPEKPNPAAGCLEADSLDVVEVVMGLDEEFGTEIPDTDAEKIKTVGDIVDLLKTDYGATDE